MVRREGQVWVRQVTYVGIDDEWLVLVTGSSEQGHQVLFLEHGDTETWEEWGDDPRYERLS